MAAVLTRQGFRPAEALNSPAAAHAPSPHDGLGRPVPHNESLKPTTATPGTPQTFTCKVSARTLDTLRRIHAAGLLPEDDILVLEGETDPRTRSFDLAAYEAFMRSPVRNGRVFEPYGTETIRCMVGALRRVLEHPDAPVRLDDETTWTQHIEHVAATTGTTSSLENARKALRIAVEDYLGTKWRSLEGAFEQPEEERWIPPTTEAHRLWTEKLAWHQYNDALLKTHNYANFGVGWRVPSESIEIRMKDIRYDDFTARDVYDAALRGDHATVDNLWKKAKTRPARVTYAQPKKSGRRITRIVRPEIIAATNRPSILNFLVHHRTKTERKRGTITADDVFVTHRGTVYSKDALRNALATAGKSIFPEYTPYCGRAYYAVHRLLETHEKTGTFDIWLVASELDDTVPVVEKHYIPQAKRIVLERGLGRPGTWRRN